MSVPLRLPAPVNLIYATEERPRLFAGTLLRVDGDHVELSAPGAALPDGARLVLQYTADQAGPVRKVRVLRSEGDVLHCENVPAPPPDKREYPRVHGAVNVRYRVARAEADADAWLAGKEAGGPEHTPDPFMNFSVVGLAWDDHPFSKDDDLLLLAIEIPQDKRVWRCTARVVRVSPIPIDERDETVDATHRIAVAFERIGEDAVEALGSYTLRIQDAWLEGSA